jgi:competence protein ComFC
MAKRLSYRLYQVYWSALDWLFPPNCGGCGKTGSRWCTRCHASIQKIEPPLCPKCGQKLPRAELCVRCQKTVPSYTALRSWAVFDGTARNALHQLKYRRNVGLGEMLARSLVELAQSEKWIIDLITRQAAFFSVECPLSPTMADPGERNTLPGGTHSR